MLLRLAVFSLLTLLVLGCDQNPTTEPLPAPTTTTPNSLASDTPEKDIIDNYENTNRVIWQKPDMVLQMLGDISDKTVADIGAGKGFFTMRLAPKVKKIVAIEINPVFTDYLDSIKRIELPEQLQSRLETRLVTPKDPGLDPNEADVVMIVNTFMYLKDPLGYVRGILNDLPPGGRLLIIDFKRKRTTIGPKQEERVPLYQAEELLYEAGFETVFANDTALDYQYILIGTKGEE
ncbi:MAG: methyltransferase domain-containing protein [Bacteroidota bacterium]